MYIGWLYPTKLREIWPCTDHKASTVPSWGTICWVGRDVMPKICMLLWLPPSEMLSCTNTLLVTLLHVALHVACMLWHACYKTPRIHALQSNLVTCSNYTNQPRDFHVWKSSPFLLSLVQGFCKSLHVAAWYTHKLPAMHVVLHAACMLPTYCLAWFISAWRAWERG